MRRYLGTAAHLIVAQSCRFHLATVVDDRFIVSTVGEYVAPGKPDEYTTIGYNRLYETMVFKTKGEPCPDGCGLLMPESWSEIDFAGYNTAKDANEGHEAMCQKYETVETVNEPRPVAAGR